MLASLVLAVALTQAPLERPALDASRTSEKTSARVPVEVLGGFAGANLLGLGILAFYCGSGACKENVSIVVPSLGVILGAPLAVGYLGRLFGANAPMDMAFIDGLVGAAAGAGLAAIGPGFKNVGGLELIAAGATIGLVIGYEHSLRSARPKALVGPWFGPGQTRGVAFQLVF